MDQSHLPLNYQDPSSSHNIKPYEGLHQSPSLKSRNFSKKGAQLEPLAFPSPSPIRYENLPSDGSPTKIGSRESFPSPFKINPSSISLQDQVSQNYKLANYELSKQFFRKQGYFKRSVMNHRTMFTPTMCCDQNLDFLNEYHSTGVYFYFELLKRCLFLLLFCSCLSGVQLYNNYVGSKLSGYTKSFSTNLAYFSLGNNDGNTHVQMYIQCCLATLQAIALVFFYIQWRVASNQVLKQYLDDPSIMEPQRYAVTVSGIKHTDYPGTLAQRFQDYLEKLGYNVHECEVILDFDNNFNDFVKLQKIMNQLMEEKGLAKQGKGSLQKIESLKLDKDKLIQQIQTENPPIRPLNIIVHFQTKLDKSKFVHAFKHYNKQNTCLSSLSRCFCCFRPTENELFENQLVLLENDMIGRPDDIYWENMDASCCSRFWRVLFGVIVILVSLVVTSTIIACCILYASGAASCTQYVPESTLASVLGNENLLYCFCEENILSSDTAIVSACGTVNRTILINNALLIVSSVASALSNIILGIIVELIISFMKPKTRSKQYEANFIIIIIATLINSCFLPLVLNASIFGYTPNAYLRIFNFINFTNVKIVSDFVPDWYVFISPYYINLFLVAIVLPWVNLLKCVIVNNIRRCLIKRRLGEILQKTADAMIVTYKFDMAAQNALIIVNTMICFTYSTSLPLLPLLHFAGICSLYITNRICLTRYSRKVSIDEELNNIIIHIIPFIILLNICFSIWALTSDTLFPLDFFSNTTFQVSVFAETEFRRVFYFMPLTACLAIVVVFIIVDYFLIRSISSCCKDKSIHPENINKAQFFSNMARDKNVLNSYKFEKNPDYKNVIDLVQKMLRKNQGE